MQNRLIASTSAFAACLLLLVLPGWAAAQKTEHGKSTYRGHISKDNKEEEKRFDLQKPEDVDNLRDLLREGSIESLEKEKPPSFLELRWDLGLWTVAVFLLLVFILGKYAWKPMLEGLQKREETIRSQLDEARQANEDAKKLRGQLQQESDLAQEKVRQLLDEGRRDAEQAKEEMLAKTRSEIQAERDRLRREIDLARDQALQDIWRQAADLATLISAKTIRRQLNADDHRRLVDEAIAEIRSASETQHA
jgi:F-type H+-transporting ATPase subunit b